MSRILIFNLFKKTALVEGVSYLVLLFIAMPLKYIFDWPLAVKYVGAIHGFLFIAYCVLLLIVFFKLKWSLRKTVGAFVISIVPFAALWFDKYLGKELKRFARA